MKLTACVFPLILTLAAVCTPPAGAAPPAARLQERLDIDVSEAPAEVVLAHLAGTMGLASSAIEGDHDELLVTLTMRNVTPRTVLMVMAESLGCRERVEKDAGRVVLDCGSGSGDSAAGPRRSSGLDQTLSMSLEEAGLADVLDALERASGLKVAAPAELRSRKVSLEAEDLPVRRLLDELCMAAGCSWRQASTGELQLTPAAP